MGKKICEQNGKSSADCIDKKTLPQHVGRLDKTTTGLMIFCNSGKWHTHLNNHVSKSYCVSYEGWEKEEQSERGEDTESGLRSRMKLTEDDRCALLEGMFFETEGRHARFDSVQLREGTEQPSFKNPKTGEVIRKFLYTADVRIKCGVYHVVKRLFKNCTGRSVVGLHRFQVGDLSLEDVGLKQPGDICELTEEQKELLWSGGGECLVSASSQSKPVD